MSTETNQDKTKESGSAFELPIAMTSFLEGIPEKGNVSTDVDDKDVNVDKDIDKDIEIDKDVDVDKNKDVDIDKKKEVSKEAPKEIIEDDENEDSVINVLGTAFPDMLEGDFSDDAEGLVNATKKIAEKHKELGKQEGQTELFEQLPILKDVKEHIEKGGSLLSLIQQKQIQDFSKVELEEDNLELAERFYRQALQIKGNDEEDIEEMVNLAKDKGILFDKGKASKDLIVNKQKEFINNQIKQEQDELIAEQEADRKQLESLKTIISSKRINGLDIDSNTAKDLEDFISKIDNKGRTARLQAYDALTDEEWLNLDMIVMNKFKDVKGAKASTTAKPLKKFTITKKKETVNLNTGGGTKKVVQGELSKLGVDNLQDLFMQKKD